MKIAQFTVPSLNILVPISRSVPLTWTPGGCRWSPVTNRENGNTHLLFFLIQKSLFEFLKSDFMHGG